MKSKRMILVSMALSLITVFSAAALLAQDATEEPSMEATEVPSSFADNRINGDIFLGGLALFCEDENGMTDGNTFQDGALTVWGPEGQEYIRLTAAQLRGDEEIDQPPPTPDMMTTPMPEATMEAMDAEATPEPMTDPVLLARAETTSGWIWLFRVGEDTFALQGTDNTGKFYTYTWTGCALGVLEAGTMPIFPVDGMPDMMATEEMTAEPPMVEPTAEVTEAA